jgi:hypothetical protein
MEPSARCMQRANGARGLAPEVQVRCAGPAGCDPSSYRCGSHFRRNDPIGGAGGEFRHVVELGRKST